MLFCVAIILSSNASIKVRDNSAKFALIVPKVSQLLDESYEFESRDLAHNATVSGINWWFVVRKNGNELDVLLRALSEATPGETGAIKYGDMYEVTGLIQLHSLVITVSFKEREKQKGFSSYFKWGSSEDGCRGFISWDLFMKNFVYGDQASFEIEFTVSGPIESF